MKVCNTSGYRHSQFFGCHLTQFIYQNCPVFIIATDYSGTFRFWQAVTGIFDSRFQLLSFFLDHQHLVQALTKSVITIQVMGVNHTNLVNYDSQFSSELFINTQITQGLQYIQPSLTCGDNAESAFTAVMRAVIQPISACIGKCRWQAYAANPTLRVRPKFHFTIADLRSFVTKIVVGDDRAVPFFANFNRYAIIDGLKYHFEPDPQAGKTG